MSEFLETPDVRKLTGFADHTKQDAWLTEHGIPHRVVRKKVIVSTEHVRRWLEGRRMVSSNGPNWAAIAA